MLSSSVRRFPLTLVGGENERWSDSSTSRMHTSNDADFLLSNLHCGGSALKYKGVALGAYVTTKGIYWLVTERIALPFRV